MAFDATYDACVLHPAGLRDLLIRLATGGQYRAHWSDILDEILVRSPTVSSGLLRMSASGLGGVHRSFSVPRLLHRACTGSQAKPPLDCLTSRRAAHHDPIDRRTTLVIGRGATLAGERDHPAA